jgi:prevent-host-death family protein
MLSTTLSDFRKETKQYLDKVTNEHETLIINRGKDIGVVIISLQEYNSLNATLHDGKVYPCCYLKQTQLQQVPAITSMEQVLPMFRVHLEILGYLTRRAIQSH